MMISGTGSKRGSKAARMLDVGRSFRLKQAALLRSFVGSYARAELGNPSAASSSCSSSFWILFFLVCFTSIGEEGEEEEREEEEEQELQL
eukprot:3339371-Rhodomonas_salina.1